MVIAWWHESMIHAEEDDDFYELQPGDYYKLISNRLAGYLNALLILSENIYIYYLNILLGIVQAFKFLNCNHV